MGQTLAPLAWALPALTVVLALASGRFGAIGSAALGLLVTVPVALWTGPEVFGAQELVRALLRGAWIAATIAPYILGGLLFWQIGSQSFGSRGWRAGAPDTIAPPVLTAVQRRRQAFVACFLVGPLAESATGFGVGMVGTVSLLRPLALPVRELSCLSFLSQTMIPWGAMGSGTLLAATFSRVPAEVIGLHALVAVSVLMVVWLPFFWHTCERAGLAAPASERWREVAWTAASLAALGVATWTLGLEVAMLASFGGVIGLRWWLDARPSRAQACETVHRLLPYVVLIAGLVAVRAVPGVKDWLSGVMRLAPFDDLPSFSPVFHAGTWLLAGGVLTALVRGQAGGLPAECRLAWKTGKAPVLTIVCFASMAEMLIASGIGRAMAQSIANTLQGAAVLMTPLVAGGFGLLTNSGNAANGLFMSSWVSLAAQAGLNVAAVATLQHVCGVAMTLFSPVRMSIAISLAGAPGTERAIYRRLLWPALACFSLLSGLACIVWLGG